MTKDGQIKIEEIDDRSPYLPTVIELWGLNRTTLGFFPKGAFAERAKNRQILVALDPQAGCIGYLLYRHSYDRITIVHLCVDREHQNKKVARLLVNHLKQMTQEKYTGIGLNCRRDYDLASMWSKLGFVPQYEKEGKSKDKKLLTFWWFDHGHQNLFSNNHIYKLESKLCVVIDANIFFNLYRDEDSSNEESRLLLADWLEPELELCITDEIFNYISLVNDDKERESQRQLARRFISLPCISKSLDEICQNIQNLIYPKNIIFSELDVRHLARAIASESHVFISNKKELLDIADEIYDRFRLSILTLNELLIQLDELRNKPDYQPVRLAGTLLKQVPVQRGQEDLLTNYFTCINQGETKTAFQQQLRRFLAELDKFDCYIVVEGENQPLALFVYGKHKKNELEVPLLRVGNNHLSATLVRHLIFQSILHSANEHRQFTRITDLTLDETVITAIQEDNFIRVNNGWIKVNLAVAETASQLSIRLATLASNLGQEYNFCIQIADSLNTKNLITDVQASANIERFLFPGKIIDAQIPNFIIPIQPRWAKDLFDSDLARQTLFGSKIELAFNREAVYYRSVRNSRGLKAPSRIIWYVSQDDYKSYCGISSVRACSFVDEIIIDQPKNLYQRFQRLGVYKLADIMNVNQDKNGNIMAVRFSNTELFKYPINLKQVQKIINKKESFQSAYKISNDSFKKLYNLGYTNKI
ncbi:GNAT family N-acetyltransferase [Nostoc sp. 'Lobaria pulmonaria (5183) cyanobiont']|uniref:GNAT family N-acetyltransferase n=1 Tax=Nostoc sp. 'Lobaria pulmonaria (5183) cyanobiont' TaxID=1618022 RepID=UPI000CF33195|nr:GNAT family N-acetyltransferase [Nostoc sp. 'Lobaria pulmonaria (5183) cyanobiont']AVH70089.1 GCN5-related N-acetyltransferase [Nostoc sp. 'Lobaria pulmonaria (5183) cyanobiont']